MFDHITTGSQGVKRISRRQFLWGGLGLLSAASILSFLRKTTAPTRRSFYQRALERRDFNAKPVTVYKMAPLPGRAYARADAPHMANKIFPSIEAARARRQHKAFLYGLKRIELPRAQVNGMDRDTLFCGRKDFDCRVAKDRRHWQRLGVDVEAVFRMVRDA